MFLIIKLQYFQTITGTKEIQCNFFALLLRPDSKNWQYQETIKKGDLLLNRVQKLSRVINM